MTQGVYVAYNAVSNKSGGQANGYAIIKERTAPTTQDDINDIIHIIMEAEDVQHVIPLCFHTLTNVIA